MKPLDVSIWMENKNVVCNTKVVVITVDTAFYGNTARRSGTETYEAVTCAAEEYEAIHELEYQFAVPE